MKLPHRFLGALAVLLMATGGSVFGAGMKVEGTPVPTPAKPDMSSMRFLIGTWTCSDLSSRRPGPFTITEVYSMDPGGYWITATTRRTKHRGFPATFTAKRDTRTTQEQTAGFG